MESGINQIGEDGKIIQGAKEKAYRKSLEDLHDVVSRMAQLRPEEKVFLELYHAFPEENPDKPHAIEDLKSFFARAKSKLSSDVMERILEQDLDENSFLNDDMDAAIYQHMRYLPAYWHSHVFFEIACVFWGHCTNYVAEQKIPMEAGDICILAPGTRHAISAFSDDAIILNVELRFSTFEQAFFGLLEDTDILAGFFRHTLYGSPTHPYLLFHTAGDFELYDYLLYAIQEQSKNRLYRRRMVNNIIMAFFTILLRKYGDKVVLPELNVKGDNQNAIYLLQYIQQHYTTVTLPELSYFFGYSVRQVQRLITELTGKSFIQNIQDMKLHRAADLLVSTNRPVTDLILDLGWSDAGNFRTLFKRKYGMTPMQYRKENKVQ